MAGTAAEVAASGITGGANDPGMTALAAAGGATGQLAGRGAQELASGLLKASGRAKLAAFATSLGVAAFVKAAAFF